MVSNGGCGSTDLRSRCSRRGCIIAIVLGAVTLRSASRPSGTAGSGERDGLVGGGSSDGSGSSESSNELSGIRELNGLGIEIQYELFLLVVAAVVGIVVLGSLLAYLLGYWRRPFELVGSLGLLVIVFSLFRGWPTILRQHVPRYQPGLAIPTREGELTGY